MRAPWSPAVGLVALAALSACSPSAPSPAPRARNGHEQLCSRRYDQVAFPGTHNAYSNTDENFGAPDQTHRMSRQLADGVRVLHLEIYPFEGDAYLCHSVCQIGSKLLVDGLAEVSGFVEANPREVVTLLMESSQVARDAIAAALQQSGLGPHLHVQAKGKPWPTLGALVDGGDRVVVLLADQTGTGGAGFPYLLDRFQVTWETPWNNQSLDDFNRCFADRGVMGNDLYVVDTYLEDQPIPTAAHARLVNFDPFLVDRLLRCQAVSGRLPNFAMVNFYEVGDLFAAVDVLNGFAPPPDGGAPVDGSPGD